MKIIKDPVHGYVEIPENLLPILDSPLLQRLRYVRQLGFSYLVYPGAHHTRFEHSLGTTFLAGLMTRQLELGKEDTGLVMTAALLHDIGHGPFSHAIEPLVEECLGKSHHYVLDLLREEDTRCLLDEAGIDPLEVASLIEGRHSLSGIIHGELDVDRMDYLLRDAHYTGAPYGTVDAHRLLRSTSLMDGQVVLHESGINAAESLLIARTLMRPAVYFHHVSRIAEMMFQEAVMAHVSGKAREGIAAMAKQDDAACFQDLRTSGSPVARELAARIYRRKLYKRALYVGRDQVNVARVANCHTQGKRRDIASRIAGMAGIPPHSVLVDIPPFPGEMSLHIRVRNRHRVIDLSTVSPLVHTLNETRREQWRLGVYTIPEHREAVAAGAEELLHIRPVTTQERLIL